MKNKPILTVGIITKNYNHLLINNLNELSKKYIFDLEIIIADTTKSISWDNIELHQYKDLRIFYPSKESKWKIFKQFCDISYGDYI